MTPGHIAVIDIGKTNAKLAVVRADDLSEIAVVTRPNRVLPGPPYPHFDAEAIWGFLMDGLDWFHAEHGIDAISVTTHGASGVLIGKDGTLAAPILDYEHTGPDSLAEAYDALRPDFAETGSPRLPMGLNLGAQIHWQFATDPGLYDRTDAILTYPQYWGLRLTGEVACDVSSLGCHTDLWNPNGGCFSGLVERLGITEKIAPARKSADVLGTIRPEIAARTGLKPTTPVLCGIHDSNASLLPHVMRREPPFSVVSTGTWVIVMSVGGTAVTLDPARDTLINVNALGAAVPSARFMGGREYEVIRQGKGAGADAAVLARVAAEGPMLMPAVVPESGPFQGRAAQWIGGEPAVGSAPRAAALSYYLAMMSAECLALSGHAGEIVVEGPFATNTGYCQMLAAATGCPVLASESATGTSQGAAMLALGAETLPDAPEPKRFEADQGAMADYAARWKAAV